MKTLSCDEFENKYAYRKCVDILDYEDVKDLDYHVIWTEVDDPEGNGTLLLPGFHFVNRLSYIVSDKPWTDEDYEQGLEVQWCEFGDDEDNGEFKDEDSV
jgi:hypothetical protein